MAIYKNIKKPILKVRKLLGKRYWLFLFLVVLVAYGQMLWMQPWQDDNALFFKLANLEGRAGYLGAGPFGDGAYKYTAAFYIPIHHLFGFNIPFYFLYTLILYFMAALAVYKVISEILGEKAGKLSGFLFAAGYIAGDGIIRLYNSPATSLSIIFISGLLLGYWKYYKKFTKRWYFFALISYFLAVEFMRYRTHYLIIIPLAFEIIFLAFRGKNKIHTILTSIVRIAPFTFIFYKYFIQNADTRTGQIKDWVVSILNGDLYKSFSFFTSITNIILPDWLTGSIFTNQLKFTLSVLGILLVIGFFALIIFRGLYHKNKVLLFIPPLIFIWLMVARYAFSSVVLSASEPQKMVAFLGGVFIVLYFWVLLFLKSDSKKLYVLLGIWFLANLVSYASYQPTVAYESANRFFAHSFVAFVFAVGLLSLKSKKLLYVGVLWGVGNLIFSVASLNNLLYARSFPTENFYKSLMTFMPTAKKGDVFYVDVAENARSYFANAFSVAQMPEETALAWRYGLDRYDIHLVTEFSDLTKLMKEEKIPYENIHSFFYTKDGLINTTEKLQRLVAAKDTRSNMVSYTVENNSDETIIRFSEPLDISCPVTVQLSAKSQPILPLSFPALAQVSDYWSSDMRQFAFAYKKEKENQAKTAKVQTSNDWRENVSTFLLDRNLDTFWQADRVLFDSEGKADFIIDLGKEEDVNGLVWINSYGNHTPTHYTIETSRDGVVWKTVETRVSLSRIETRTPQVTQFTPTYARFVRMVITKTISGDSPTISEAWVVPTVYSSLNILETESFLKNPLAYVNDSEGYLSILKLLGYRGSVNILWKTDKTDKWETSDTAKLDLIYDGHINHYSFVIPPGGTKLFAIKFSESQIPGEIKVVEITGRNQIINEVQ